MSALRPKQGVSARIWRIADEISARGTPALRKEVMAQATREGIHPPTASKQYNDWRLAQMDSETGSGVSEAPASAYVTPYAVRLQIGTDGRVLIPIELRRAMRIGEDGFLKAELVAGELRLISPAVALEKLQTMFAEAGGMSAVDELLAERRTEAARE